MFPIILIAFSACCLSTVQCKVTVPLFLDQTSQRVHLVESYESWDLVTEFDELHHFIRMRHRSPELLVNVTLVNMAKQKAMIYAWYEGNPPPHHDANDVFYGENYHFSRDPEKRVTPSDVMEDWYRKEEKFYDYSHPQARPENMHFLRIVSKTTQEYGCGQARNRGESGGVYTVCIYWPEYVPGQESVNIGFPIYNFDEGFFGDESELE